MVQRGEQRERGRKWSHELSPDHTNALKGVTQPRKPAAKGMRTPACDGTRRGWSCPQWQVEGTGLLGPPLPRGLGTQRLGYMVALGCCFVRAKRNPTCQLWRVAGSQPRGPCGLRLQGSPGVPLGAATSPELWQRPSRLDRKVWRKEEGVRAGGRGGQGGGGGVCHKLKAYHFAEI